MIVKRLSPSVSVRAVLLAMALPGCSESSSGETLQLGSVGQALGRSDARGSGPTFAHGGARHQRPFHVPHHRPRRCDNPPEPTPEPVTFTPATAAARSGRRAGSAVDVAALGAEPVYAQLLAEQFSD